jgi:hypothetical protein
MRLIVYVKMNVDSIVIVDNELLCGDLNWQIWLPRFIKIINQQHKCQRE